MIKKPLSFISFLGVIIVVLTVLQVGVSNRLSTTGFTLAKIQQDIIDLHLKNTRLSEQVLSESSFTRIASQAATLGYVEAKNPFFISPQLPLARK